MLLELKNIHKSFLLSHDAAWVHAVAGVDLSIREGENVGLVGESGSGKTTLGRVALRLYRPEQGKIYFLGRDLAQISRRELRLLRRSMQMVFQDPWNSLDPRFSIRGLFLEALNVQLSRQEKSHRMEELLRAVGLPADALDRFPHEFSGGERQRIAIARALLMQPKLLILDEAVSSLDVLVQEQILELLRNLQGQYGVTYWFISHNLRAVRKICQRVVVMCQGKIVEAAGSEELFAHPRHPYTKELLSAAMEYKASASGANFSLGANSRLIDQGKDHFVLI